MLRGKCVEWLKRRCPRRQAAAKLSDGDNDVNPEQVLESSFATEEPCPASEDLTNEVSNLLNLDLIEGCRINIARSFTESKGELGGLLMLNLGTYDSFSSPNDLLKALLQNQQASKGGTNWATSLKYVTPSQKHSFHGRYTSKTNTKEFRYMSRPTPMSLVRFNGTTQSLRQLSGFCRQWITSPSTAIADSRIATGSIAVEHGNDDFNLSASAAYQDAIVASTGFATKLHRKLWGSTHLMYIDPSGACLLNYNLRFKPNERTVATAGVSVSPNFNKPAAEGMRERVYNARLTGIRKLTDIWTVGGEVEVPISRNLKEASAKVGYECAFPSGRVQGTVSSNLVVEQNIVDASGLQLSGSLDFLNDDYKVGFGLNLNE